MRIFVIILLFAFSSTLFSQEKEPRHRSFYFGINPSITVEPFYEKGEFDVNVFPLIYQLTLNERIDLRFSPLINLGIRNDGAIISHVGGEIAMPIFFFKKESRQYPSKGFFASPIISYSRNFGELHNNIGLWIEPGFHLLFDNHFAFSFGVQTGATYFSYDSGATEWGPHFGVKVIFGKWFD